MSYDLEEFRYHRSATQEPYDYKDSHDWGTFVRYIELGDDGFAMRQVDEYRTGQLCRYDRAHWDDQFGTLASLRFGEAWLDHWGTPIVITRNEFEEKWASASESMSGQLKGLSSAKLPPWLSRA